MVGCFVAPLLLPSGVKGSKASTGEVVLVMGGKGEEDMVTWKF